MITEFKPKDVGGVDTDRAMVSEATRAMARGDAGGLSLGEVRAEKLAAVERKSKLDAKMCALNDRVRGVKLAPHDYRRVCEQQREVREQLQEETRNITRLNSMLREISPDRHAETLDRVKAIELAVRRVETTMGEILRRISK